jgi:hypothetical protein
MTSSAADFLKSPRETVLPVTASGNAKSGAIVLSGSMVELVLAMRGIVAAES